ncbi:hypothetical protein C491_17102 [Natronococcus amylolyticus DSM 10524]|uniref:Sugar-specific transcriptional regulator TrmB n=1 Tax=Natronococcus amylolyticus DSM 10524 TaxID=1227497 RepID=L9X1H0_9EURY|nr:hypothetical protein [Natronococcus amylolyticus]ELY55452.1 hypothetical protein C491_17102 [Natronococcus amylolyticus DSM 10524]
MKEPRSERRTDAEPPEFDALVPLDELVRGERTRDDFFDAVLGLETPATVGEVAERAGHGVDAAREYLEWFDRMGIVTRVTESPATYERNRAYLNWRRVQHLRDEYSSEELLEFLRAETERAEGIAEAFDGASPDEISIADHASETGQSVEDVWEQITDWKTARRRIALLERALTNESGDAADQQPAV